MNLKYLLKLPFTFFFFTFCTTHTRTTSFGPYIQYIKCVLYSDYLNSISVTVCLQETEKDVKLNSLINIDYVALLFILNILM